MTQRKQNLNAMLWVNGEVHSVKNWFFEFVTGWPRRNGSTLHHANGCPDWIEKIILSRYSCHNWELYITHGQHMSNRHGVTKITDKMRKALIMGTRKKLRLIKMKKDFRRLIWSEVTHVVNKRSISDIPQQINGKRNPEYDRIYYLNNKEKKDRQSRENYNIRKYGRATS